jgi:hypothetical protein
MESKLDQENNHNIFHLNSIPFNKEEGMSQTYVITGNTSKDEVFEDLIGKIKRQGLGLNAPGRFLSIWFHEDEATVNILPAGISSISQLKCMCEEVIEKKHHSNNVTSSRLTHKGQRK